MERAVTMVLLCACAATAQQAAATMESELKKYAVLIRERGMKAD
jgi:hypothetical protein